jgi:hypothetical protein
VLFAGTGLTTCAEALISFGSDRICAAYVSAQGYPSRVAETIETTIAVAIPADACSPLQNAPDLAGKIVIIDNRGDTECPLVDRLLRAQSVAALAVIVVNGSDVSDTTELMNITIAVARVAREVQATLESHLGQPGTISLGKGPRIA